MLIEFLKSNGADWDYSYGSPIEALKDGLGGASVSLLEAYRSELRRTPPTRSEVEDALNVALTPEKYQGFLIEFEKALVELRPDRE